MQRFEWQTDEEGPIAPAGDGWPTSSRRGRLTALIVASLALATILVTWQVGRQAARHEQSVREDVRAAFGVWQRAIAGPDADLLGTLLMDGEARWTATQRELLETGRALDRTGLGLSLVASGPEALPIEAEFDVSRDWRSAEITFPQAYLPEAVDGRAQVVHLEQTVALVRDGSRWLLRRPEEEFWGIWHTLAGNLVAVTFRERDTEVAERLLDDLDRDLGRACDQAKVQDGCLTAGRLNVRLESDPSILLKDIDPERPAFFGRTFVLPAPTLVGNPLNDEAYQALYSSYAGPILSTFAASLASPVRLPRQIVTMICFSRYGNLPRLYSYDPAADSWSAELENSAFRFLTANEDDSRIALRQHFPRDPNRLRVVQWASGQATVLRDETYDALTDHGVGWAEIGDQSGLLLAQFSGTTRQPAFHLIMTATAEPACPASGCPSQPLDGFPIWSPDGARSLVQVADRLHLADGRGLAAVDLGEGHDPFWLDDRRFGFIRPAGDGQRQAEDLVVGAADDSGLTAIWRTEALDLGRWGSSAESPFYIQHVAVAGAARRPLLLYGRQYAGENSLYAVYSLDLVEDNGRTVVAGPARLELALDEPPAALPSADDPNGHAPFVLSPDGRWLTAAYLVEKGSDQWVIQVTEIGHDRAFRFQTGYPNYSFRHPFFDWSADGRWLLIVDEEFIRLAAPESGFERIVAHDQRHCSYPAWLDR